MPDLDINEKYRISIIGEILELKKESHNVSIEALVNLFDFLYEKNTGVLEETLFILQSRKQTKNE